jgi:hypothetical protein
MNNSAIDLDNVSVRTTEPTERKDMNTGVMSQPSHHSIISYEQSALGITQRQQGAQLIKTSRNKTRMILENLNQDLGQDSYNTDIMNKIYFETE